VVGARKHVLHEGVERRVVDSQLRSRVDRVVKAVGRRRVSVSVEITLNTFALRNVMLIPGLIYYTWIC